MIDEYTFFYLKWIEPIRDQLKRQSLAKGDWQAMQSTVEWNSWLGFAFESVCYKHLGQIKEALELPPMSFASTWRYVPINGSKERGAQIDLLFDRRDDVIHICEIKHNDQPFVITKDYFDRLNQKIAVFKARTRTHKQIFVSFITASGVKENKYSKTLLTSVVTLGDLLKDEQ